MVSDNEVKLRKYLFFLYDVYFKFSENILYEVQSINKGNFYEK